MFEKICVAIMLTILAAVSISAQEDVTGFETARKAVWQEFNKKNWHAFDFTKKTVAKTELAKLKTDGAVSELELLRGVVFGKRGRIFKERNIQDYLVKQSWYKPNKNYDNKILSANERRNIDSIREAEARKHDFVQPGDLRFWQTKTFTEEQISPATAAEWSVLIAEVEAIHGKRFDEEPWLQKYFEERYWYKPNANYNPAF